MAPLGLAVWPGVRSHAVLFPKVPSLSVTISAFYLPE
uniref:Uncharacterized protein n=1 Tax=Anguilla anguilla TaxID=7936 RepID=A0A0E9XR81_ANGAN